MTAPLDFEAIRTALNAHLNGDFTMIDAGEFDSVWLDARYLRVICLPHVWDLPVVEPMTTDEVISMLPQLEIEQFKAEGGRLYEIDPDDGRKRLIGGPRIHSTEEITKAIIKHYDARAGA